METTVICCYYATTDNGRRVVGSALSNVEEVFRYAAARSFYLYQPTRSLTVIEAEIKGLEQEIMAMLAEVV